MPDHERSESFTGFVLLVGPRLKQSLIAALGGEAGREATCEALAWAWENWPRLRNMENPAGYLYKVGRNRGLSTMRRRVRFTHPEIAGGEEPWVEPALAGALARLGERQRVAILLIHGYGWTYREVARHLGLSTGTVQTHVKRGMAKLRHDLKVEAHV